MDPYSDDHFDNLAQLQARLKQQKLSILESHYHDLSFGDFTLVTGAAKNRLMFAYDGREGWLVISQSAFANTNATPAWTEIEQKAVARAAVFSEVEQQSLARLKSKG